MCSLRFPVHPFIMELFHHLNIAPRQLLPNPWRIVISCMTIWLIAKNKDMIRMDELLYLYCLKESKQFGYYELVPWDRKSRLIVDFPSSFQHWKLGFSLFLIVVGRLRLMIFGVIFPDCCVGRRSQNLVCCFYEKLLIIYIYIYIYIYIFCCRI